MVPHSGTLSKFNAYWCVFSGYPVPCTGYLLWETIGLSKEVLTRSSQDLLGLSHQKKLFFKVKPIYENIDTFKQYEAVKFSENCIRQVGFFFCDAKSSIFRFLCLLILHLFHSIFYIHSSVKNRTIFLEFASYRLQKSQKIIFRNYTQIHVKTLSEIQ